MDMKSLKLLRCPYCLSNLNLQSANDRVNSKEWGILKCRCDEYPIVLGIIYLQKNDGLINKRVVDHLKKKQFFYALKRCLSNTQWSYKWTMLITYIVNVRLHLQISRTFLLKFLKYIGPHRAWFEYLIKRNNSYEIQFALKQLQATYRNKLVVDIGCGIGYLEELALSKFPASTKFIAVDKTFFSLLLFRLYVNTNRLMLICADVESGIPLNDKIVTNVVFCDSFCQIQQKKITFREVARILQKKGNLSIINLYSDTLKSHYWGYGIDPKILIRWLCSLFTSIKFFNNCHFSLNQIEPVSINQVPQEGYSCTAVKK